MISTVDNPLSLRKHYGMHQSSIDFYPGSLNIVLSVPHDGDLKSNLPSRPAGACRKANSTSKTCYYQHPCPPGNFRVDTKLCPVSHGRDRNTRLLALALRYELGQLLGLKPFVVINRLERTKVDMNRFIDQGTFGAVKSMHAWMAYHFYVRHARELIVTSPQNHAGKGLLFDLHSQEHEEGWVELGYLLTSRQLAKEKVELKSSSLASYFADLFDPDEIIRGNRSLGHFITKYWFPATPSPIYPSPPAQSYFDWGYTIEEYGRHQNFSAIMIESPSQELLELPKLYVYAKSLAMALHDYLLAVELLEPLVAPESPTSTEVKSLCNQAMRYKGQISALLLVLSSMTKVI